MISGSGHADKKFVFLIYLFWPFAALVLAIKNYKMKWSRNIVWLFVAYFGYIMVPIGDTFDATREKIVLAELHSKSLSFKELTATFYSEDSEQVDIVNPLIHFTVSRFTDNYHILFLVYGLIFGFFYSRNIWMLIEGIHLESRLQILLVFTFSLIVGYWSINGFRYWTATEVFLYGCLTFFLQRNYKGIIFIAISSLFHFSFFMPAIMFTAYLFLRDKPVIYFYIFLFSFLVKELNIESLGTFMTDHSPAVFHSKINNYTDKEYVDVVKEVKSTEAWHVIYSNFLLKWTIVSFIVLIFYFSLNRVRENRKLLSLYSFGLLFGSVANVSALVPSGGRFLYLTNLIFTAFIFLYISEYGLQKYQVVWRRIAILVLIFFILFQIRLSFELEGLMFFIGNPLLSLFFEDQFAIITLLKSILGIS